MQSEGLRGSERAADGTTYGEDPIRAPQGDVWQQAGSSIEPVDCDCEEQQVGERTQHAAKDKCVKKFIMGTVWRGGRVRQDNCGALALLADCTPAIELCKLRREKLLKDESERFKSITNQRSNSVPAVSAAVREGDWCVGQYRLEYPLPDEHALARTCWAVSRAIQQVSEGMIW